MIFFSIFWKLFFYSFVGSIQPLESKIPLEIVGPDGMDFLKVSYSFKMTNAEPSLPIGKLDIY